MTIQLNPQVDAYNDGVSFYVGELREDGRYIGQPVVMVPAGTGQYCDPTFRLRYEQAQELFEKMWAQGFRSKHDRGASDRLDAARQEHITDLRKAAKLA
jgi:hypothetical protein